MTIRCKCEHCGVSLKVKDELAGKQKKCPQCGEMFSIPATEAGTQTAKIPAQRGPTKEDDFPYFDEPVKPLRGGSRGEDFSSPLSGGGADPFDDLPAPARNESRSSGSAAGIAGELLKKIETTDRKSKGSGASNKKKRRIFGDVEEKMSTSEESVAMSLMMLIQGFLLPLAGLSALVVGAYFASNYFLGPGLKLPPLGKVKGTIKIDGQPVRGARIEFHPMAAVNPAGGENLATSMAMSDGNGNYELYYGSNIPGAVIGQHKIMISATDLTGHELVPPSWNASSNEVHEVKKGSNTINFEIVTSGLGEADPVAVDPASGVPAAVPPGAQ